jgi:hypothetical protein
VQARSSSAGIFSSRYPCVDAFLGFFTKLAGFFGDVVGHIFNFFSSIFRFAGYLRRGIVDSFTCPLRQAPFLTRW